MRSHIASSTAIAILVALGVAAPAMSEVIVSPGEARKLGPERAREMGGLNEIFVKERAAGVRSADLTCLDGSARPCADNMPLMTPAGVAVELIDGGGMILAPARMQPFQIGANKLPTSRGNVFSLLAERKLDQVVAEAEKLQTGQPRPRPEPPIGFGKNDNASPEQKAEAAARARAEAERKAAAERRAEADRRAAAERRAEADRRAAAERQAEAERKAAAERAEADRRAAAERRAEADRRAAAERQAETQRKAAAERAEADRRAAAERQAEADRKAAADRRVAAELRAAAERRAAEQRRHDELARQIAAARAEADKAAASLTLRDRYAGTERRISDAEARKFEADRATAMPALNDVLSREVRGGLTADDLACMDGAKRPCADGVALVTPGGVTTEVTASGRLVIGPMSQQQYIVNEDGSLRARGSNTEAAREAAQSVPPEFEALTNGATGKIVRETVAEENTRSSAEDFEMSLTEALARATESARKDKDDDDSGSDLAKVALVGLGALAVGEILSGQREVALNTGDRVIVTRNDGSQQVLKDDNALLRQPGNEVQTENYSDGSSRTVVKRPDGSQIITIRGSDLTVLRRVHVAANGAETVLIDESVEVPPVEIGKLPPAPAPQAAPMTEEQLRDALAREAEVNRRFTLNQIRTIPEVRNLVAPVDINAITFDTGSAAIYSDQARQLASLGQVIEQAVAANPREIFLIEGHTDAVGSASYNLALSDRRAESVALALSEYFDVPPENLVVQGYGEEYLKVPVLTGERQNRRASVRRITDLLASTQ